ncbi:hypothetical protein GCM10010339_34640 [Streptomyces alanosinicus]|uniref:Uncharacterized protein n=1 Tax=Streptomyces alanosinicus TaxID=68171 RepID=A0A919D2M3_9ACTN|nr:hypothetical protein GCM10010339_34640 [Streptomyces alanosinicus]
MVEVEVDEPAEVEGGGPVVDPAFAFDDAAAGYAAIAVGDEPGDDPFDHWPPTPILSLPLWVDCLFPGCGLQIVVRAPGDDPASF